ncbi:Hypothetical protein R9X50_00104100 [Acrodontium crateriforme]|uniref:Smr domain-containing protein n=1 Tax=Acrodontium crateriforme TaxID=150365 RepID=A0AAQ3LYN4_9PEZI|nr:Hypothetical protein R9X50_00104100 [Acrodontium crateriforme]
MDNPLQRLESEYCPPLDPALLSAILSDYDLRSATAIQDARATLDALKEAAILEETAGFDPSGTGGAQDGKREESSPDTTSGSVSRETDLTSFSNGGSLLELEGYKSDENGVVGTAEDLERLDDETKVRLLQEVFGDRVSKYSIQHTLKKYRGKWQGTMEELLNHVYFNEGQTGDDGVKIAAKGIDGFSEDNVIRRKRKGKGKKGNLSINEVHVTPSRTASLTSTPNRWDSSREEVDFIAARLPFTKSIVHSTYFEQSGSLRQTIRSLLKSSMEEIKVVVDDDAVIDLHIHELQREYSDEDPENIATVVRLTHPSMKDAREIATALTAKPEVDKSGEVRIVPQYTPYKEESDVVPRAASHVATCFAGSADVDHSAQVGKHSAWRATALSQARAAQRKAKSDRLMSGAGAYYREVYQESTALLSGSVAAAADELAARQSSETQVDLHGIDVLNGVRIARQKVNAWWNDLGEGRVNGRLGAGDRAAGFKIIVGAGRHSEGGKSKLGPAVTKALQSEGWKLENAGAVIIVKGKAKR